MPDAPGTPMCPPCSREWLAWLDYRLPPPPIGLVSIGGRDKAREIADLRKRRLRDWRETVQFQQGLIRRLCLEGGHTAPEPPRAVELVAVAGGLL